MQLLDAVLDNIAPSTMYYIYTHTHTYTQINRNRGIVGKCLTNIHLYNFCFQMTEIGETVYWALSIAFDKIKKEKQRNNTRNLGLYRCHLLCVCSRPQSYFIKYFGNFKRLIMEGWGGIWGLSVLSAQFFYKPKIYG